MVTGSAVLRAVERKQLRLDEPVAPFIDPELKKLGLGSMTELFGAEAATITADHLGTMRSGVPDYDTAKPWPRPPMDPFRAEVYSAPSREWDPASILNQSWVAKGHLDWKPGNKTSYSSTNFVLLGLLLSSVSKAPTWDAYDQRGAFDALPSSRRDLYSDTRFAVHGPPSRWTSVHGYDRTSYNGANSSALPGRDVVDIKGVYGGWTASDLTTPVADTARLAYDLYGKHGPRMLTPASVARMVPTTSPFYGFATFNLSRYWGPSTASDLNTAYGHLGATYGYQSVVAYFPGADVALSVASNIETDGQTQPSDVLCLAYNAVLAALHNTSEPKCKYVMHGYYGGYCDCGNNYQCGGLFKKQCRLSEYGSLSKADCEASCIK